MSGDLRTSDAARRAMRAYLEARDGRACRRCGDPIDARETAEIGHVVSRRDGGSDAPSNLGLEHTRCNRSAGADRDRARIVVGPIFQRAIAPPALPSAASNGAGIRRMSRTSVRYGRIEPDGR